MEYQILGRFMPVVEVTLAAGESICCQAGAMKWMDESIEMDTQMRGGIGGFIKRSIMGESGFMNVYRAKSKGGRVVFGHTYPGTIIPLRVDEKSLICQKRAFLASEPSVTLDVFFQRKLGVGFFGGEGFIMQKLGGRGMAFVEIDGEVVEMVLTKGQSIKVETGAVAMIEQGVSMDITMVKGLKNIFLGGEGMFLTTLTGPGKVWLQTMSIQSLANELFPFLPLKPGK